jgi:hypothetical protein
LNILSKEELQELVNECQQACVSIYMPTQRAGKEVEQNAIRLKNRLEEAEKGLVAAGLRAPEARELLEPVRALLPDTTFWQHQSDGLALFISAGFLRYYRLPLDFESLTVVGGRFHFKPLLSLFAGDGRFYVLALSQDEVRLLQGTRYSVGQVNLENVPERLAEALKWDEPERNIQFHTSTGAPQGGSAWRSARGGRPAIFHGHGVDSASEHKEHILHYFRQVSEGMREILAGERAPLVLAAVDYLHPLYREANVYPHLVGQGIRGNPEGLDAKELHARAWAIVEPLFTAEREAAAARYRQLAGEGSAQASNSLEQVVPAAHFGRVETLFVALGTQVWGTFDPQVGAVELHQAARPGDEDLLDFAAVRTLSNDGTVYVAESGEVPGGASLAAVYRY